MLIRNKLSRGAIFLESYRIILLGSDFNAYGMARSFYELQEKRVDVYAAGWLSPIRYSSIMNVKIIPGFNTDPVFIETMRQLKNDVTDNEKVILVSCGDGYTDLLSKHKAELAESFICPVADYELIKQLVKKESFYELCEKFQLPYPKTKIINLSDDDGKYLEVLTSFEYPLIIKPASRIAWRDAEIDDKRKAYIINSYQEAKDELAKIEMAGYQGNLIVQEYIPGDDSNDRVLNAYVGKDHKVKFMSLGHPLLEDPSPEAIGNYLAILPEYDQQLYDTVKGFLEKINYTGYANFDLKYDSRDQSFKFFEINTRQGRSSFYTTLTGDNLAAWLIRDYINDDLVGVCQYANQDSEKLMLWLGLAPKTFLKYARESQGKQVARRMIANKRYGNTFWYSKDVSLKRWLLYKRTWRYYTKLLAMYADKIKK